MKDNEKEDYHYVDSDDNDEEFKQALKETLSRTISVTNDKLFFITTY